MILVIVAGALCGTGVFLLAFPKVFGRLLKKLSHWLPTMQRQLKQRTSERHRSDLALTERIAEDMVVQKLVGVVAGAAMPAILFSLLSVLGVAVDNTFAIFCSIACAFTGFVLPDQRLKTEARRRRQSFLHAFSSFLDLTNVLLAGGAGTETALMAAADAGDGWAFGQLRNALVRARSARTSPWNELAALGERFNLTHVTEVAGSVQLAGEHGARIRSSLSAKAESLRHRQMSESGRQFCHRADGGTYGSSLSCIHHVDRIPRSNARFGGFMTNGSKSLEENTHVFSNQTFISNNRKEKNMTPMKNTFQYYWIRFTASRQSDLERGEVSATTVVMAAALIALAIAVGATITARVRDKANSLDLG